MNNATARSANDTTNTIKVLIVDDIFETRENTRKLLSFESDMEVVGTASTGREAIALAQSLQPDVILMDINMPDMDGLTASGHISKLNPGIGIIMMSVQNEAAYIRQAMLAGARYFLTKPIIVDELYEIVRSVYANKPKSDVISPHNPEQDPLPHGKVIVVSSLQGGTGKTMIATNLAVALMNETTKVLLVDCALQSGDVGIFLNLKSPNTLLDLARSADDLDPELVNHVLLSHASGLKVLLAPATPEEAEQIQVHQIVTLFTSLRDQFDVIIVDTASKIDELALGLFDLADMILLVTNPILPSIKNTHTLLNLTDALGYKSEKVQLVLNRVNPELERAKITITGQAIQSNLKRTFIGIIPDDERRVLAAINQGIALVSKDRHLSPGKDLLALADTVRQLLWQEEVDLRLSQPSDRKQSSGRLGKLRSG